MSDPIAAVEAEAFTALDGSVVGATVYQDAPEDAPLPLIVVGDINWRGFGLKDDPDRQGTVSIFSQVNAEERAPLLALQDQIETTLDGHSSERDGWSIAFTYQTANAELGEDGATYVGVSLFAFTALAA